MDLTESDVRRKHPGWRIRKDISGLWYGERDVPVGTEVGPAEYPGHLDELIMAWKGNHGEE